MFNNFVFFPPENRGVYEIIWKNIVQPDRSQMTILHGARAPSAGYLRLKTHSQNMYSTTYCFLTAIMVTRTRLDVTLHVQCHIVLSRQSL